MAIAIITINMYIEVNLIIKRINEIFNSFEMSSEIIEEIPKENVIICALILIILNSNFLINPKNKKNNGIIGEIRPKVNG